MDRALETGCRTVTLGKTLTAFLSRLGLSSGGKTHRIVREQVERISRCRLTFHLEGNGRRGVANQAIIDSAMFFDGPNTDSDGQASLFTDALHLSEGFYSHLRQHNVFLDGKAIEKIHANSRALDVYSWLAFRLHHLGDPTFIPWVTLRPQFRVGITVKRNFPSVMRDDLMLALSVYEKAKVDILDRGVMLHPSPPPVQRRPLSGDSARVHGGKGDRGSSRPADIGAKVEENPGISKFLHLFGIPRRPPKELYSC
jgi:hypothetical protein